MVRSNSPLHEYRQSVSWSATSVLLWDRLFACGPRYFCDVLYVIRRKPVGRLRVRKRWNGSGRFSREVHATHIQFWTAPNMFHACHIDFPPHFHGGKGRYLNTRFLNRKSWALRSPDLTPLDFSLWEIVEVDVYFHICQQVLVIYGEEIRAQLQMSCHANYVAPGKEFIIGGIFVVLHLEVTMKCNSDTWDKIWCVWIHVY